jgi:hypothetical protein
MPAGAARRAISSGIGFVTKIGLKASKWQGNKALSQNRFSEGETGAQGLV